MFTSSYYMVDPQSAEKTVMSSVSFVLLGSVSVKAAGNTLVKSTPGVNFINVL